MVVANHEVGTPELIDQRLDVALSKDSLFAGSCAVGHAYRHAHVTFLVPAADVPGGALRFEVKVDEILQHEDAIRAS